MTSELSAGEAVDMCSLEELRRILAALPGKRVTVMGLGLFGGGEGVAKFLLERGARLTVTDLRPQERLRPAIQGLAGWDVTYHLGGHIPEDFIHTDLVVANPAVPRSSPYLRIAREAGVPVTSAMNIFLALCPGRVVGVTGSNGKSTTSALIAAILEAAGHRVFLGGNIGGSLLCALPSIGSSDTVVLELSSFQLEDLRAIRWSPHVAVVTKIRPNHLDRHGTMEAYAEAKRQIVRCQKGDDFAILNAQDAILQRWMAEGIQARLRVFDSAPEPGNGVPGVRLMRGRLVWCEGRRHEVICVREDIQLRGMHNVENVMAAVAASMCLGVRSDAVRQALSRFSGLEHRLQLVGEFGGVRYYNDSYSTTPDAGIAALESFGEPCVLIAGGYDKKLDLRPLARAAARTVDVLITMGQTGPCLAQMVREESLLVGRSVTVREAQDLQEAVSLAQRLSMPGSTVIFSPSCPSYDMFENYRHRGEAFCELVRAAAAGNKGRCSA